MYKLGIIGTGRIANRMVKTALVGLDVVCSCVYNPHMDSARRFAKEHNICEFTNDLDKLASAVDMVYIASPHETHVGYAEYMLNHGKHVLCEKPMALNGEDAARLFKLASGRGLILMEAIKTAFCPGFIKLEDVVGSGKIGRVVDIEAAFTRLTPTNVREYTTPVYNGSMLEFGSYGLLPVLRFMGTEYNNVTFNSVRNKQGVDIYTKANFEYEDGMGTVKAGLGVKTEGQLVISGTKGYIIVPSPWWMTRRFQVRYEDPSIVENYEYEYNGSGLQYEMSAFIDCICAKKNNISSTYLREGVNVKESLAMASVMEDFLKWNKKQLENWGM